MLVVFCDLGDCDLPLGFPSVVLGLAVFPVYQVVRNVVDEFVANDLIDVCGVVLCFLNCLVDLNRFVRLS